MSNFEKLANRGIDGLMTYEPGRPIEEVARELGFSDISEITKLASNENALGPSPLALEAMAEHAKKMHLYPDGGAYYLKKALAAKLGVEQGQLLIGNGSNELLEFIGHVFLGGESGIVMADCAFVVYKLVAAMFGAPVVTVPMRNLTHDLDAMLAAITPETRVVFVANPNNPTGTIVTQEEIDAFMDRVPDDVIVLRTFSKTYGLAGLRVGYAVAPKACIKLLNRVRQPFNVNSMALAAAQAAVADDAHVERTRKLVTDGLRQYYVAFEKMGLEYIPSSANFMLVKVGAGRSCFEELKKLGVIVRPMDGYGLPDHIRITVGTLEENECCIDALRKIRA